MLKCFFGTIFSVVKSDGVVEGGTGEMKKEAQEEQAVKEAEEILSSEEAAAK